MSTPWPPVRVNGTELQATSEVHYRKLVALQRFVNLQVAERLLSEGEKRVAIDAAYHAAELCAKAFLLGKVERTPSRHGSIVQKFGEIYILQEQRFPPVWGTGFIRPWATGTMPAMSTKR